MSSEKDYVLGTHDEEIERLGLQHRVWRPRSLDAWRRAGITAGQTILDVGCGPGYASCDLAEIVGADGRVLAIDRSRRFLDALRAMQAQRALNNITPFELDLDEARFPDTLADGAWTRWVFAFVKHPQKLLARVAAQLKPNAPFIIFEYFNYASWRLAPRLPELEEFVAAVMKSWRADGGEPDIALDLPRWLEELNFEVRSLNPIVDVVRSTNYVWRWPSAFLDVGIRRLVDIGGLSSERGEAIRNAFAEREGDGHSLMITPGVLEIIAVKG